MEENKSSMGSVIGIIIILALIVLGAFYFWGKHIEETKNAQNLVSGEQTQTSQTAAVQSASSSDDLDSIEADLNTTETVNLAPELSQ